MFLVSDDTLLRVVRRQATIPEAALTVVGVDDWATRRNHRYGTIVCDLAGSRILQSLRRQASRKRPGNAAFRIETAVSL